MGVVQQVTGRVGRLVARAKATHPGRAYQRYGDARGNVLAGGIAYFAFFSVFPALAVALTLLGFTMQGYPEVRDYVVQNLVEGVDDYLPGLVHPGQRPAGPETTGIYIDEYLDDTTLTIGLLVSLGTLLFTGLGWVDAMRRGIRAVFGEAARAGNPVLLKARDLLVLVVIGLGVALSVTSVVLTRGAGEWLLGVLDVDSTTAGQWLLTAAGFAVAFCIDTATFLAVFRVLPGANVPLRQLLSGALLGGVGIGLLKQFGIGIAGRSARGNEFLGAAASIVVILVLMNLIGRLILLAAAWAATRAEDADARLERVVAEYRVPLGPLPADHPSEEDEGGEDAHAGRSRTAVASSVAAGALGAGALVAARRALRGLLHR
ncbi:YihY/virulence factor BrkB family protein [Paenibacillus sp. TRM 82003]|uniref:YihY/virulence factor BrkB family protein n=1 Tax=Kineococcus sp. TRM81007 TaxID=2925831 RepID=UPI001F5AA244|nr:YihY/virulence factor BrkB family protein [Kineococcus sp. TRM81007]MCI2238256.1 YihY/virulence factor BrkB family protein [Kineococcus sp. TRM81007]MCI3924072.1 YihY/virulence factor BrkB family protein [Paenibacillus sp. TRM 82003]